LLIVHTLNQQSIIFKSAIPFKSHCWCFSPIIVGVAGEPHPDGYAKTHSNGNIHQLI